MEAGALAVTLETLLSGVTELPFRTFSSVMLPIHLAIGIGEGIATGAVLFFIRAHLPEVDSLRLEEKSFSLTRFTLVFGLTALLIGGGLSLLASGKPDGLEWAVAKTSGSAEPGLSSSVHTFLAALADKIALLPDYGFSGGDTTLGSVVAGVAGVVICAVLLGAGGYLICRRKSHHGVPR